MSQTAGPAPKKRYFTQAPIEPVSDDGVKVFAVGTLAFAIFSILAWWQRVWFADRGHAWLPWSALAGLVIGLIGLGYVLWRRSSRRTLASRGITPDTP